MNTVSGPTLDPPTLLFSLSLLSFLMAAVSFSSARASLDQRLGLNAWGNAMLCAGGAFLGFFFRGHASLLVTLLLPNLLVLGIPVFGLWAHSQLAGRVMPWRAVGAILAAGCGLVVATQFFGMPRHVTGAGVSASIAVLLGKVVVVIAGNRNNRRSAAAWVAGSMVGLMALVLGFRAVYSLYGDAASVSPASSSSAQVGALLVGAWFIVGSSMGYLSMVNERQRSESVERLRRDGLTGLYTRTAFFEETKETAAPSEPKRFAVVMIDIDHFKAINDTYGHVGGDVTLSTAGSLIASSVRSTDVAGRYGGEEFCVLLRGCGEAEAEKFALRLLQQSRAQVVNLSDGRTVRYTLSLGYACGLAEADHGRPPETVDAVINRADQALYYAKQTGRDRAISAASLTGLTDCRPAKSQMAAEACVTT